MTLHLNRSELLSSTALPSPPPTMRALRDAIAQARDIPPEKLRAIVADLDRFLELSPAAAAVRPHGACLRPLFGKLHPATTGLSPKRIANIIAHVRAALKWSYATWPRASRFPQMRPEWTRLKSLLIPRSKLAMWLSRLIHWANLNAIDPGEIDADVFAGFAEYLDQTAAVKSPIKSARQIARHWNMAAETVPGWPQTRLPLPSTRTTTRAAAMEDLSDSMAADLAAYLRSMQGENESVRQPKRRNHRAAETRPTSAEEQPHIYSITTVRQREQLLRRAIGLTALERGCRISDLSGLADLVAPGMPGAILDRYDEELGLADNPPASLRLMSLTLFVMARRYLNAPESIMFGFRNIIGVAGPERFGMTEKNRSKLKSLTRRQYELLFRLPSSLLSKAIANIKNGKGTVSDLVNAQIAVAIAILLHAPIRGTNLASIKLGHELDLPAESGAEAWLKFSPDQVKNDIGLDFPLPPDVTALICAHVREVMPEFSRSGFTSALFPGLKCETKAVSQLGSQIASRITEAIGMRMNQHLFRHLLAYIYLARNPGKYEVVRHLLGHKSVETTKKYYCGAETEAAIRDVAREISSMKLEFGLDPRDMSKLGR